MQLDDERNWTLGEKNVVLTLRLIEAIVSLSVSWQDRSMINEPERCLCLNIDVFLSLSSDSDSDSAD